MRPITLHLEGFGSFRDPTDLDFDGADFFALVGPTGSGKSTIIDAICFALYGSVPRYEDEKLVGRAVALGRSEAKVSLVFDVRGERYVATRVVRAREGKVYGAPKVSLERVPPDGPTEVVADKVKSMKDAVEELLGLQFAHFTKCVVLPQGAFARFLHDDPSKRQDLLVRLLDLAQYERVARRARRLADDADADVRLSEQRLDTLAAATDARLAAATAHVERLGHLQHEIEDAVPHDEKLAGELKEARTRARDARAACSALAAVRVPEDLLSLDDQLRIARETRVEAEATVTAADAAVERFVEEVEAFGDLARLERVLAAYTDVAAIAPARAKAVASGTAPAEAVERCDALLVGFAGALDAAQAELEAMQAAHAHAQLREQLTVGEPCPVCEQKVRGLPELLPTGALADTRARVAEIRADEDQARRVREEALAQSARSRAELEALDRREAELQNLLVDQPDADAITAVLGRARDTGAALDAARSTLKQCNAGAKRATTAERELDGRVRQANSAYMAQRDPLVALGAPLSDGDDLVRNWRALESWAAATFPDQEAHANRADTDVERTAEARAAARAVVVNRCRDSGVVVDDTAPLNAHVTAVVEAKGAAAAEAERLAAALTEATGLRKAIRQKKRDGDVARSLANLLRADHFERWLVTEALDVLVHSASDTLYRLSGGQYSLACEDGSEFVVIDHRNADERRAARTLSGGETFQASLALALALSEQVATLSTNARSRLDAIFLDEGFGTLDADALETVASTIEHLGTDGRMVGIVTHVPALAERVPVRYRVAKNDRTSTVVREDV
ncbi:MAG: chromosome segregation protein [Actinomycetia bacterium]|nr:chromosome segregation protein [Actinomycetes bacterium]